MNNELYQAKLTKVACEIASNMNRMSYAQYEALIDAEAKKFGEMCQKSMDLAKEEILSEIDLFLAVTSF